jgi:hypothetical protein
MRAPEQDNRLSKDGDSYPEKKTIGQVVQGKWRFTARPTIFLIKRRVDFRMSCLLLPRE